MVLLKGSEIYILHGRLRMLCSSLNDHLYSLVHVVDNHSCVCGYQRENNKHYLLWCHLYINERIIMLKQLEDLNFNATLINVLYGDKKAKEEKNIKPLQEFIKCTNRFF